MEYTYMKIKIASARSVKGNNQYKNELITWDELRERFTKPLRTYETTEQYHNTLSKQEKTTVKDRAGVFLGGWLEVDEVSDNLDRNLNNVVSRSILNFDFDNVDNAEQVEDLIHELYETGLEFILYSTHSHAPNKPRVRVLIPLDREVSAKEFEAISRHVVAYNDEWARMIDTKSFKPAQAMFYATATKDGEYLFDYSTGRTLSASKALEEHHKANKGAYKGGKWWEQPKVPSELKTPIRANTSGNTSVQDPTKKPSYIGAFNRAYNIHEAIETFLADKYTLEDSGKYTWNEGEGAEGALVYDDFNAGDFLYSHHETDPAGEQLLNAFDLVRTHLYNELDAGQAETPINERESYKQMIQFIRNDDKVKAEMNTMQNEAPQILEAKETPDMAENLARTAIDKLDFEKDTMNKLSKQYQEYLTEEEAKQLYLNGNASAGLEDFMRDLSEYKEPIKTDFPIFDRVLDGGLHDGLYIVGAISSLGKTTFVVQMADQIAKLGQDVLFFSLEMSAKEIKAKSISRLTFENVLIDGKPENNAKTVRGITDLNTRQNGHTDIYGQKHPAYTDYEKQLINRSIKQYADEAKGLYIIESIGDLTVEDIRAEVAKHKKYTGNTPVVIVDYLQILAPADDRKTDKQNTDHAVKALKHVSRDYLTPVFAISSLNRANYSSSISMSAFKESGAIEYSSDILIGLQFSKQRDVDEKNRNKRANEPITVLDHDDEKSREPREIELKILKNRNGVTGVSIDYEYYAKYNSFKEKELVSKHKPKYTGALFEGKKELETV